MTGVVMDMESKEPIPFATIQLTSESHKGKESNVRGTTTDIDGRFTLKGLCDEEMDLIVSHVGYKQVVHHHDTYHASPKIFLAVDDQLLESVVVEDAYQEELKSVAIQKKELSQLAVVNSSIGELTEEMSGVSVLKTGANISKPIIHGLHSNRVLVINDGVRHAFQVWGLEHAPEIDPSHVDRIEIVKGAGTVKYGPEALGGVILYNSKRPAFDKDLNGSFGYAYHTNGRAGTGNFNVGHGAHRFAWNVGGFGIYQGDLKTPNYDLTNTGRREYGASFNTLLHQKFFDLQVSGSYFNQELGILRGSIVGNLDDLQRAIDRGEPSPTLDPSYDIQNPKQDTEHGLINTNLSFFLGEHVINLQYAFQQNIRREFDVRRGELNDRPVIDLELKSQTAEIEWIQPEQGRWNGSSGIQLFTQNSVNEPGSNPINFVPDYDVFNVGAFTVQSLNFDKSVVELGVRFDYQTLSVADTIRDVAVYANEVDFSNATFTLGFRHELNRNWSLFSNIGSAWRPPNVSELYSFGYHFSRIQFGLWRYQITPRPDRDPPFSIATPLNGVFDETDREVPSEKSYKWVSGLEWKSEKINAEFVFYVNLINDYIFLRPFGVTTNVAGTFPYFLYDQTNARFIGSDWDIRYKHTPYWTSELKLSYVRATELENNQPFIEIPPFNANYSIDYLRGRWGAGLSFNYSARQWNAPPVIQPTDFQQNDVFVDPNQIFDFMAAPDDFLLLGAKMSYQPGDFTVEIKANNVLNTAYRVYTDRLRYFSESPGRNITISIGYKF
ncbi:MAG: TonB-dependent receptor [Cytophagales bacterium]|nr:TonB-dependent receptor [Cytophagales bacterium]